MVAERADERAVDVVGDARRGGLHAVLAERDAELKDEQLVELQSLPRVVQVLLGVGEVDRADRRVERGEMFAPDDDGRTPDDDPWLALIRVPPVSA